MLDFNDLDILTIITFLPLLGAAVVVLFTQGNPRLSRAVALFTSLIVLFLAIPVFVLTYRENLAPGEFAFENQFTWFELLGSSWHVGVDGISASMVLLTAILTPIALLIAFEHDDNPAAVMALFLFMQTGMLGVFVAMDMLIFFLFYEIGLVPMYFIIYLWGGPNRDAAARKFFIFTMAGSLGLLLSIQLIAVAVGQKTGAETGLTFDIPTWMNIWPQMSLDSEILGFSANGLKWLTLLGFTFAFALKIPIWPLHTWLPDAHTEAPTAGSMLLAGVLLKLGAYGFLRLVIPLFPMEWVGVRTLGLPGTEGIQGLSFQAVQALAFLATVSIVLGAFNAWAQDDFKKLVAYSSVNHMGFVAMGLAVFAAVYGSSFALSLSTQSALEEPTASVRPDLLLNALGDPLTQEDVDQYLRGADLDNITNNQRAYVAYEVLRGEQYGAEIECVGGGVFSQTEAGRCYITRLDRLGYDVTGENAEANAITGDRHNAIVAANGAVFQMFNHGLSAAGMFLLVGALYHKAHTRDLRRFGGLWHTIPAYSAVLVFTAMASLGLPGLNGFVSEYLVIAGAFPVDGFEWYILISMIGLFITGAYILKSLQKVLHGPVNEEWDHYHRHHHSLEISRREMIAIAPLMVLMLITGLYPNWVLSGINDAVSAMLGVVLGA